MNEWWPVFLVAGGHMQYTHSPAEGATAKYCAVALFKFLCSWSLPAPRSQMALILLAHPPPGYPPSFSPWPLSSLPREAWCLSSFRFKASSIASGVYLLASLWHLLSACPCRRERDAGTAQPLLVLELDHSVAPGPLVKLPPPHFCTPSVPWDT